MQKGGVEKQMSSHTTLGSKPRVFPVIPGRAWGLAWRSSHLQTLPVCRGRLLPSATIHGRLQD